ncbi:MAG: YcbK family protein [Gammaproteobacteria bacterium]|nr:YcbK family protein [Gammaproteobacteria bacterium]
MAGNTTSRRRFLALAALSTPVLMWPGLLHAAAAPRRLAFHHTHTGEALDIEYSEAGRYIPDALLTIDHLLRDFRSGEVHPIDPALLDTLYALRLQVRGTGPFEIISAFRSPATNAMLARKGGGVSTRSLHLSGRAIDIRLPGVRTADLRDAGLRLRAGGVGYYPDSDFIHVDTGRVRNW